MNRLNGRRWWWAVGLVFFGTLLANVPTTGDIGLTWDEPSYRYSQLLSIQWWERLGRARSSADLEALVEPDSLLYYWPYGRYGINFHPPLAGQLNLASHVIFGPWMKDVPSRRMASVIEFTLTITILFGFLSSRYCPWVGGVAACSLLLMPRVYGDGHIAATDMPGLLLWAATAVAFWKGLLDAKARRWRVLVGVLLGLAFLEKMAAVAVLVPILAWLVAARLPKALTRRSSADWIDGLATTSAMLLPLGLALREVVRFSRLLPVKTDLYGLSVHSDLPGAILLVPLGVWLIRRLLGHFFPSHPIWGVERPALETWTAILAFAPPVGWLGNPAWWRETLPRLGHYYAIVTDREQALPPIDILYFGQTYQFSLPWHNAWVWIAITVPAGILAASLAGLIDVFGRIRRDRLPLYFLVHLLTLPILRMFPTPAHDGVRLFLPTFFFLAALAGWGLVRMADGLARISRIRSVSTCACWLRGKGGRGRAERAPGPVASRLGARSAGPQPPTGQGLRSNESRSKESAVWCRGLLATLVLGSAAGQLVKVHPFELSYYNELSGGPAGAWRSGFELAYWYDAINGQTLDDVNRLLPPRVSIVHPDEVATPPTFQLLQDLGQLRGDLDLGGKKDQFFYVWILTQDAKAAPLTRLLFAMRPWYARRPRQLDGLRVVTVADPVTVSRAWALRLLTDARGEPNPSPPPPAWARRFAPWLGRFWGSGVARAPRLRVNEPIFTWAKADPDGLRAAARTIAERRPLRDNPDARKLMDVLVRFDRPDRSYSNMLLRARPIALVEAVEILIAHPEAVRTVLLRYPYTDPAVIGGPIDRDLPVP